MKKKITGIIVVSIIIVSMVVIASLKKDYQERVLPNAVAGFELLALEDFDKEEVLQRGYPALLDLGGDDCIPCKEMKPVLEELNEEWQGEIIVKFVDVWKYPKLADQFHLRTIPTQYFYDKEGNLYETHEGSITKEEIITIFEEMGYIVNG
jgi:thioredoxin 1